MFNLRSVFAFWTVVVLFLGSAGRAQAQATGAISVTVPTTGVRRDHQDYAGKVLATQMNYKDCLNEDYFSFTVNVGATGVGAGYSLEIWAGTGCDMTSARPPSLAPTCWQVATVNPQLVNTMRADVRKILSGRTGGQDLGSGSGGTGGTGGTDSATGGADATGGAAVASGGSAGDSGGTAGGGGASSGVPPDAPKECTPTSTAVGAQSLTLYFMLLDGSNMVGGQTTWKGTYKLLAPDPPTGVTTGTGENIAPVSWTATTMQTDQTIDGYQLYCDPAPGQAGLDEAGVVVDPGILPTMCTETLVLRAGSRPDDKYKCGTASKTSTHANATGLVNNAAYHVAVAATDTYRNIGVVSEPACAFPQPVTGFFEAYRDAGGEGGGGFCSFSRHGRPVLLFSALGLALCLVLRRRRAT